jgi:hypothetical protein
MPHTQQPDPTFLPHVPICPTCTKSMRLVTAEPITPYINLKHAKFECDCGFTSDGLIADRD